MSRRLNIERRRKRIRHYTARRRRRSPVHRAILYWWGTALLLTVTAVMIGLLLTLRHLARPGRGGEGKWVLPAATLRLIYASEAEVAEALRMGNARRSARAMSDADIGISFESALPEPAPLKLKPLSPLPAFEPLPAGAGDGTSLLPPLYAPSADAAPAPALTLRAAAELTAAGYSPQLNLTPPPGERGTAVFFVRLDASGRTLHVLRLAPSGEETPWLRDLRLTLTRTRAAAAAVGKITVVWNTKDLP